MSSTLVVGSLVAGALCVVLIPALCVLPPLRVAVLRGVLVTVLCWPLGRLASHYLILPLALDIEANATFWEVVSPFSVLGLGVYAGFPVAALALVIAARRQQWLEDHDRGRFGPGAGL